MLTKLLKRVETIAASALDWFEERLQTKLSQDLSGGAAREEKSRQLRVPNREIHQKFCKSASPAKSETGSRPDWGGPARGRDVLACDRD